jgi:hypothetical protein
MDYLLENNGTKKQRGLTTFILEETRDSYFNKYTGD